MSLHYLEKLKIQTFCRYSAIIPDMEENANKLHLKCTDFNSSTLVTAYAECIYVFLLKSCTRHWIPCWSLTKHCSDVCCDEFPVPQIDRNSKQVKEQWHEKSYLQSVCGTENSSQQTSQQCLSTVNMVFNDEDKILILLKIMQMEHSTCKAHSSTGISCQASCQALHAHSLSVHCLTLCSALEIITHSI